MFIWPSVLKWAIRDLIKFRFVSTQCPRIVRTQFSPFAFIVVVVALPCDIYLDSLPLSLLSFSASFFPLFSCSLCISVQVFFCIFNGLIFLFLVYFHHCSLVPFLFFFLSFFLVADTRLHTLPCRSVGPSVTFLNCERFSHYRSCQTVRDCIAVYPALFENDVISWTKSFVINFVWNNLI